METPETRRPLLVISGFVLVPLLGVALPRLWGQILGSIVLGSGWILLGRQLHNLARVEDTTPIPP